MTTLSPRRRRRPRSADARSQPSSEEDSPASWYSALLWSPVLPLSHVWPLVVTSLLWYCVTWFAISCMLQAPDDIVLTLLASMQFLTATFSTLHWLDARSGWRCAIDKLVARTSFALFTVVAIMRIRDAQLCILGWPLWLVLVLCYRSSQQYWDMDGLSRARWVGAHVGFHCCVGIGQCLILYGVTSTSSRRVMSPV